MSGAEKKFAVVLVVILIAAIGLYIITGNRAQSAVANPMAAPGAAGSQVCTPTGDGTTGVPTQEFGQQGAKMEITAALPITHGCHVQTEAELKKAYERHKDEIHLIIYDLFGSEGQKFVRENGGMRAVVFVNAESVFDLKGKKVKLEFVEGGSYVPGDILPIIEQELKKPAKTN